MEILGVRVDAIDMAGAVAWIAQVLSAPETPACLAQVVTINPEGVMLAREDQELKQIIEEAALVTPDGSGILWAAEKLGRPLPARVTGIDLLEQLAGIGAPQGWRVYLLGAKPGVAEQAAETLGIDAVYSDLLPAGKVEKVEELLREKPKRANLAFVGDGINDAPVLSRADIGIAMGAMGSDAAIEAADVVLMDDDPLKISKAIRISRKCLRIVYQNIWFAIGVKLICLALGALGIANMWLAIFADVGVMILAVLNAVRALFVKKL